MTLPLVVCTRGTREALKVDVDEARDAKRNRHIWVIIFIFYDLRQDESMCLMLFHEVYKNKRKAIVIAGTMVIQKSLQEAGYIYNR